MKSLLSIATVAALSVGFSAGASAQAAHTSYYDRIFDVAPLLSGRSVFIDRAPRTEEEADQIVMGLRVPNGLRAH